MDDSALKREVVIPPPRESAAAVALVSALALVGALATTAFAVRTRHVVEAEALSCGAVSTISSPSAEAEFLRFSEAREDEAALFAWLSLPAESRMRTAAHRELIARRTLERELEQNTIDATRGDCTRIAERFSRLKTLMPDQILPTTMAFCEP